MCCVADDDDVMMNYYYYYYYYCCYLYPYYWLFVVQYEMKDYLFVSIIVIKTFYSMYFLP
jgi:hypothetical protein